MRVRMMVRVGDAAAFLFSSVGVTPERVAHWLGVQDCGCEARREGWNALGFAVQARICRQVEAFSAAVVPARARMAWHYFRIGFRVLWFGHPQ
jgi:hypothetical protein